MTPAPAPPTAIAGTDWATLGTILGIAIAIAAIVIGVWATRRWGTRRNHLRVDYRVRPLRPFRMQTGQGVEVIEPNPPIQFDVELRLTNRGPQDILPEHFDGRELRFGFAPGRLHPGRVVSNLDSGVLVLDEHHACLTPTRIGVGKSLHFMVRVVDSRPDLWVRTPLANVRVSRRRHRDVDASPIGGFTLSGANKWLRSRVSDL
ncbi:hypothetical protein [Cellulomonas phragmiteti]|uniref:DUF58 domain-containing protein n=1 Tax=Cellulomonas phragmiteti TaxID=478780 RepID=A0ABQ4DRG2_9CELL|nr:hypothetical protein [Cellulomonas phragmiteti]GIG41942.1 hypothetical protein Cph01nite_37040 [Cellulomonas phragmiteti]